MPTSLRGVVVLLCRAVAAFTLTGQMDELHTSWAVLDSTSADVSADVVADELVTHEFEGSSDHTIAEAVRRALSHASTSLRTLDGAGVLVIPEIDRRAKGPRFRVTLRVSAQADAIRS